MTDTKTPTYPLLWYTSNTPLTTGQRDCAMARYLGYHAGVHGTGYRRTKKSVPLVSGGAVHKGIELLGEWILDYQRAQPTKRLMDAPVEVTAWAAAEAARQYRVQAESRGLLLGISEVESKDAIALLINEQATLVEALVWVYAIARLPIMLASYRLLAVEVEEAPVLDCTCGLGDWLGQADQHEARGCTGIVQQGKADFLWEKIEDGSIAYEEFKTKSAPRYDWEQAWEHATQLFINMEAASARIGKSVDTAFVPVLYKGSRKRPWGASPDVPKTQDSPLVYGYYDPGSLPVRAADWQSEYESYSEFSAKKSRLPQTYKKTPIWDPANPLEPIRPDASRVETWVRKHVTQLQLLKIFNVLGPFPKPTTRVPLIVQGIAVEESDWRARVNELRRVEAYEPGDPNIDQMISRSWNCTRYYSRCEFWPVCNREPGWEDLSTHPDFQIRAPHHVTEREAFERVGVVFPPQDFEGDDEGEE